MEVEQTYELVEVDSIEPHPDNPNHGDVELIGESIEANGWYGVITCQRSQRRILAGEHRWRAAKAAGAKRVPVVWRDVDDSTAIRIMLADNEIARHAVMDHDVVAELLDRLGPLDMIGTGYGMEALEEYEETREEREKPEVEYGIYDPGDDVYENQYGVIVMCEGEEEQAFIYGKLKDMGYVCRVVTV